MNSIVTSLSDIHIVGVAQIAVPGLNCTEIIKTAAESMAIKVSDYKKDQLPGGKYWDPPEEQKQILKQLVPNNLCESIFGLNDWIKRQNPL